MQEQYKQFQMGADGPLTKRGKDNSLWGKKPRFVSEAETRIVAEPIVSLYASNGEPTAEEGRAAAKAVHYPNTEKTLYYIRVHGGGFKVSTVYDPPVDGENISLTAKYANDQPHFPFKEVPGEICEIYVRYLTDRKAALLATVNRSFAQV